MYVYTHIFLCTSHIQKLAGFLSFSPSLALPPTLRFCSLIRDICLANATAHKQYHGNNNIQQQPKKREKSDKKSERNKGNGNNHGTDYIFHANRWQWWLAMIAMMTMNSQSAMMEPNDTNDERARLLLSHFSVVYQSIGKTAANVYVLVYFWESVYFVCGLCTRCIHLLIARRAAEAADDDDNGNGSLC